MTTATPPNAAESTLERAAERIAPVLAEALAGPGDVRAAARYAIEAGGKRLRPALLLATADALRANAAEAEAVAAAWECVHTYSLVHDDLPCMDDDDLRRGRPSTHRAFSVPVAVRAGAYLLATAFSLVGRIPDLSRRFEVARILGDASGAKGMVGGQALDILGEHDHAATVEDLERIHKGKTAALISGAVVAGGVLGGASAAALERLARAGASIGLAFQIADDILDATSTPEAMGKPTQADASKGKRTYPALLGIDAARARADAALDAALRDLAGAGVPDGPLPDLFRFVVRRGR